MSLYYILFGTIAVITFEEVLCDDQPRKYPDARRDESVVDDYHGVKIVDAYRWLEHPDSEDTKTFVDAQNVVTRELLDKSVCKTEISESITKYWDFPKYNCPYRKGNKYFYKFNKGLENQSVLYAKDSLEGEPRVVLNPNELSKDGTISLEQSAITEDGTILAYALSASGSDWTTIHFKHVDTGEDLPDVLKDVKFSGIAWTFDKKGVFYSKYPDQTEYKGSGTEGLKNQKLYYHTLGTPQAEDVLVEFPDEDHATIIALVSDCGRYLIVYSSKSTKDNTVYFFDLHTLPNGKITETLDLKPVVTKLEADYSYVTNDGPVCIFHTNKDAPNYRLIKINLENPSPEHWETFITEHNTDLLEWASGAAEDKLVLSYLRHVKSVLQVHDLPSGNLIKTLPLDVGTVIGFYGDRKYPDIFYKFTSFNVPGIIYSCDLSKSNFEPHVYQEMKVNGFNSNELEISQVFYSSKDGTEVPMFIVNSKGIVKDGKNPVLMYGYGGFNIKIGPFFSVQNLVFIHHMGGVLAVSNIRGGGEYGQKWYDGGRLLNKQNTFDDFHAAAEFLIKDGYTTKDLLAIQGGSNGGLLVAACINQRPDLYKAAVVQVGVLDLLRFHKFTAGRFWTEDYGCSDDFEQFKYMLQYSPLHNVKEPAGNTQYPATFLMTADHDDRVVPLHSLKLIATIQHTLRNSKKQTNPIVIRVDTKAGHGAGKPTSKLIDETTDILTFLQLTLGLKCPS